MIKRILFLLLIYCFNPACAETIKTDVLVIGGTASGTAAAIQCARSKIKTILIEPGPWLGGSMTSGGICILDANKNLSSGIYGEFRKKVMQFYSKTPGYDTTTNATLKFEPHTGAAILQKITDTVKNLTVKLNTDWENVKKDDTGWDVTIIRNGSRVIIKTHLLIDATDFANVAAKAGVPLVNSEQDKPDLNDKHTHENSPFKFPGLTCAVILKNYGPAANKTITQPENYNPDLYRCLKEKDVKKLLNNGKLPNNKYLISWYGCSNAPLTTPEQLMPGNREDYFKKLRLQTLGLVYYLQTDFGYKSLSVDDTYETADHLPYTPYICDYKHVTGDIQMTADDIYKPYNGVSKLYRTAIAVGDAPPEQYPAADAPALPFPAYSIPLGTLVINGFDNLIVTSTAISVTHMVSTSICNPAVQMVTGQGAGTIAAFCAFFKTTTQHLNVRTIQGELLDFKAYLLPMSDIPVTDPDFRAIQQVSATGLLQTKTQPSTGNSLKVIFAPDSLVYTAEIKPVINEIYARGFLWFNKARPGEYFTIGNLLSFISEITLTEPKKLQLDLQKQWKTRFNFKSDFDINSPATRREFAVLANRFLNPFERRVDLSGKLIN